MDWPALTDRTWVNQTETCQKKENLKKNPQKKDYSYKKEREEVKYVAALWRCSCHNYFTVIGITSETRWTQPVNNETEDIRIRMEKDWLRVKRDAHA